MNDTSPSTPKLWNMFDNFYMQWRNIWIHHIAITTTRCVNPDVQSPMKSCITPGLQRMQLCSGWGSYPTWKGSHIPSQHMKSVWIPSYAVGGWAHGFIIMPLPPSHELTEIWEASWKLYHCWVWAEQDDIVQWLIKALTQHEMVPTSPPQHIPGLGQCSYAVDGHSNLS